jgi:hypothetical protein
MQVQGYKIIKACKYNQKKKYFENVFFLLIFEKNINVAHGSKKLRYEIEFHKFFPWYAYQYFYPSGLWNGLLDNVISRGEFFYFYMEF